MESFRAFDSRLFYLFITGPGRVLGAETGLPRPRLGFQFCLARTYYPADVISQPGCKHAKGCLQISSNFHSINYHLKLKSFLLFMWFKKFKKKHFWDSHHLTLEVICPLKQSCIQFTQLTFSLSWMKPFSQAPFSLTLFINIFRRHTPGTWTPGQPNTRDTMTSG